MGSFDKTAYEQGLVGVEEQSNASFAFTALKDVSSGTIICHMVGDRLSEPSRYTVQVDQETHVDVQAPLKYTNHSCEPNCQFDFQTWSLVAVREVKAREYITFNYLTTEYDMAEAFNCLCRTDSCIGTIKGFKHLKASKKRELLPSVSPVVKALHLQDKESAYDQGKAGILQQKDGVHSFISVTEIPKGTVICKVTGPKRKTPTRYTVQIGIDHHVDVEAPLKYTNHSCNPNSYFDYNNWTLVTSRKVHPLEQITFNYLTTEYDMAEGFKCHCNEKKCFGHVKGYKYLKDEDKEKLEATISPVLKNLHLNEI